MNPGTILGPYRVDSLIGAGGMGEVYLGTDTRLDRQVAIKILASGLANNAAVRERFEREAKTISSLNHPNICTLFDLGRHGESDYLVMEYVQGETLLDRIARGPIPPIQVVRIGVEIARALDAAHRQGIIHRDLKPGNVMLTRSGVKLLDFGLAKLSARGAEESERGTAASMLTEQKPLTEEGSILGTFQYMSPEQVEGRPADARSDIFALGAVLYEMATGKRAFQGTSRASLIAAILDREPPPMSEIQPLTPPGMERLIRACLAKDPDERLQTAHDAALQLGWVGETSSVIEPQGLRRRKKIAPWIVAALFGAATLATSAMWWRERTAPPPPYSFSINAPADHSLVGAGFYCPSPDGRTVALVAVHRESGVVSLWAQRLDDGSVRKLADKVSAVVPFWSPDGDWIGFVLGPDRMMRVRPGGGQPELITRSPMNGRAAWSEDGTIIFTRNFGAPISVVSAAGGDATPVTRLDPEKRESYHGDPRLLPGDGRFLFISRSVADNRNEIRAGSLDGSAPVTIMSADALVGYSDPWLLFVRDGGIYAQRFDAGKLRLEGEPARVVDNAMFSGTDVTASAYLSRDGALTWQAFRDEPTELVAFGRNGATVGSVWKQNNIGNAALSSDEQTLAVGQWDRTKGAPDVSIVDLQRGIATRLTSGLAAFTRPQISPDGSLVAFNSDRDGMFDIYLQATDGSTKDRLLWKDEADKTPSSWSPDGRVLAVIRSSPKTRNDIWMVPVDPPGKSEPWLETEHNEVLAVISPDGNWVAYVSSQSGESELYVRRRAGGRAVRVSTSGGGRAAWSHNGSELLWIASGKRIMSAAVVLTGDEPRIGTPQELFTEPRISTNNLTITRDGRILLVVRGAHADMDLPIEYSTAWTSKL